MDHLCETLRIRVAVERIARYARPQRVGLRERRKLRRLDELHRVLPGLQSGELIKALLHRGGAQVITSHRLGQQVARSVEQTHHHPVDPRLVDVLHAIAIEVLPDVVAQFARRQLDQKRLHVARRIQQHREERVRRQLRIAAGDRVHRQILQLQHVRLLVGHSAVVGQPCLNAAVERPEIVRVSDQFPDRRLHLAEAVLPAKLRIPREVLRHQPVDLRDLRRRQRTQVHRLVARAVLRTIAFSAVIGAHEERRERIQTPRVVKTVRDVRVVAVRHHDIQRTGPAQVGERIQKRGCGADGDCGGHGCGPRLSLLVCSRHRLRVSSWSRGCAHGANATPGERAVARTHHFFRRATAKATAARPSSA